MFIYWYGAGEEYGTAAAASATASGGLEAGPPTITPVHPQSPRGDQVTDASSNSCAPNRPRSDDHGPLDKSTLSKLASKLLIKEDFPEWTKVVFNKPRTKYTSSKAIGEFTH